MILRCTRKITCIALAGRDAPMQSAMPSVSFRPKSMARCVRLNALLAEGSSANELRDLTIQQQRPRASRPCANRDPVKPRDGIIAQRNMVAAANRVPAMASVSETREVAVAGGGDLLQQF